MPAQYAIPETPRVISPSPTPSERSDSRDSYFGPTTRSSRRHQVTSPPPISEEDKENVDASDPGIEKRARSRSRSPVLVSGSRRRRLSALSPTKAPPTIVPVVAKSEPLTNGYLPTNGHLSPYANLKNRWRDFSRSPSPLGLIPLHRHYRNIIHRHEIPRKLLHVSIGFLTLHFYARGLQTSAITPWLLSALLPVAATDFLRHRYQSVNKLYIRFLGALMRETEVTGYNGVIWYLLGAYISLRFFSKDVGVMGVLLLSWCDTAASTFGRIFGRYTVRLRRGKSLAGTLAAWGVGVLTAATFWGFFIPYIGPVPDDAPDAYMFTGQLNFLPDCVKGLLGWVGITPSAAVESSAIITGPLALGVMSMWTGVVAAGSELVDFFGWDDNLTIPVLSGIGLWGFLKVFG